MLFSFYKILLLNQKETLLNLNNLIFSKPTFRDLLMKGLKSDCSVLFNELDKTKLKMFSNVYILLLFIYITVFINFNFCVVNDF